MRLFLLSSIVFATGCGSAVFGVSLNELPAPKLYISASTGFHATGSYHGLGTLSVGISTGASECIRVSRDVTATINEMSLGSINPGGSYYSFDAKDNVCNSPSFFVSDNHRANNPSAASRIPNLTDTTTKVVISDGETEWQAEFHALCAPRSVALAPPAMGPLRAGDPVVLQWSPATDVIAPDMLLVRKEGADTIVHRVYTPTVKGSTLTFPMPALTAAGRYTFEPRGVTHFRPGVVRCEGPGTCEARCTDIEVAPATLDFAL